jgi:heat shock protein HslJ
MIYRNPFAVVLLALAIIAAPAAVTAADTKGEQAADAGAPKVYALPADVLDVTWQWIWFGSGAEEFDVDKPELYTVQFAADGSVAIQADCNRGMANVSLAEDNRITLSPVATTMMLCPDGSLDGRFLSALEQVALYFQKDGDFFLEASVSSGTLRFRKAAE